MIWLLGGGAALRLRGSARGDGPAWPISPMYSVRVHGAVDQRISAVVAPRRSRRCRARGPRGGRRLYSSRRVGLLAAGRAGSIQVLEQVAFLVALCGLVLLLFGISYVRVAWAALAYLLLMVPLWDAFTEPLH